MQSYQFLLTKFHLIFHLFELHLKPPLTVEQRRSQVHPDLCLELAPKKGLIQPKVGVRT